MSYNPDRFVVIDGVQISRVRALRSGLIDESGRIVRPSGDPVSAGPSDTRARSASSARSATAPASTTPDVAPAAAPAPAKPRGGMFGKKGKGDAGTSPTG